MKELSRKRAKEVNYSKMYILSTLGKTAVIYTEEHIMKAMKEKKQKTAAVIYCKKNVMNEIQKKQKRTEMHTEMQRNKCRSPPRRRAGTYMAMRSLRIAKT